MRTCVLARELFAAQAEEYAQRQAQIAEVDAKLMAWHKADECSRRLTKIPGVGPIGAALLMMKTPAPEMFRSGRQFAAWIGLTPKGPFNGRQGQARRHHKGRRRSLAQRVSGWGNQAIVQQVQHGGRGSPPGSSTSSSANRRSWPPWRWPTKWPASPGS